MKPLTASVAKDPGKRGLGGRIDPRLKILYILGVGVAGFVPSPAMVQVALLALQLLLWVSLRLSLVELWGSLRRILFFVVFIVISYSFFGQGEGADLYRISILGLSLPIDLAGLHAGLQRAAGVVAVILAAQIVQRSGPPESLVQGLRGLHAPQFLAYGLDLVLRGLGPRARGGGRRKGRRGRRAGGGEGPENGEARGEGRSRGSRPEFQFKRLIRGDVSVFSDLIRRQIANAEEQASEYGLEPEAVRDLAIVVGLTILAMTLKLLRILPGLPVAPGHKGVILIPLYFLAAVLSRSRWGATRFGLVMGVTSFLLGMGKFGPFDILRHVTPGVFLDVVLPPINRVLKKPGVVVYSVLGVGVAVTRLSTLIVIALLVQAPPAFYALIVPSLLTSILFGSISGFVTFHLLSVFGTSDAER